MSIENNAYNRVKILAQERPDWITVLRACLVVSDRVKLDGKVAGSWVFQELQRQGGFLPNNLLTLIRYNLLKKDGESVRGGHRAYYEIVDRPEIERALLEI